MPERDSDLIYDCPWREQHNNHERYWYTCKVLGSSMSNECTEDNCAIRHFIKAKGE